ncbi:duf866 domain containing protein [Dermatophagoides farinae]|uniref:Duf866 domain containing protein n=1 Tax=Dermatophagoides farinae TaxID=6954 RepID=A0A9D4NVS2_DERFA|nr:duf866 domain containing protein [Dermatophagoides farinae]
MRVIVLEISAQLENVTNLTIPTDYTFHMHFRCNNCHIETDLMKFSSMNKVPLMGGKTFVNLIFRCKQCTRPSNVSILNNNNESIRPYCEKDSSTFQTLCEFDCRGCYPTRFIPFGPFHCYSSSTIDRWQQQQKQQQQQQQQQQQFNDVDLRDLDWAEYDERAHNSVGIYSFKYRFRTIKKECHL